MERTSAADNPCGNSLSVWAGHMLSPMHELTVASMTAGSVSPSPHRVQAAKERVRQKRESAVCPPSALVPGIRAPIRISLNHQLVDIHLFGAPRASCQCHCRSCCLSCERRVSETCCRLRAHRVLSACAAGAHLAPVSTLSLLRVGRFRWRGASQRLQGMQKDMQGACIVSPERDGASSPTPRYGNDRRVTDLSCMPTKSMPVGQWSGMLTTHSP